jgi:hypothetical protein
MLVGGITTAASIAILCFLWATWPEPPDPSQMSLTESWWAWMDLREGLDGRLSWYTARYIEAVRLRRVHVYMTLFGAGVGLVTTLAAFVMRKSKAGQLRTAGQRASCT